MIYFIKIFKVLNIWNNDYINDIYFMRYNQLFEETAAYLILIQILFYWMIEHVRLYNMDPINRILPFGEQAH